ncbi:MAG: hypothetical protein JSV82_03865 [Planctomycetota bacterium]|nr:MAG: hypothetical protein JSV82_03865 [Planctomycetota bacterium]
MEDKRKPIMIAIIVVCFVLAIAITIMTRTSEEEEILDAIDPTEMTWVKCRNPNCEALYEISIKEHAIFARENRDPETGIVPGMVCKECGDETVYGTEKCDKCGAAFERGSVPEDFTDRCPECGYSAEEEKRKASRRRRSR